MVVLYLGRGVEFKVMGGGGGWWCVVCVWCKDNIGL